MWLLLGICSFIAFSNNKPGLGITFGLLSLFIIYKYYWKWIKNYTNEQDELEHLHKSCDDVKIIQDVLSELKANDYQNYEIRIYLDRIETLGKVWKYSDYHMNCIHMAVCELLARYFKLCVLPIEKNCLIEEIKETIQYHDTENEESYSPYVYDDNDECDFIPFIGCYYFDEPREEKITVGYTVKEIVEF